MEARSVPVADLDEMTNAVFAAIHANEPVLTDRYMPPKPTDEWKTIRLVIEKIRPR